MKAPECFVAEGCCQLLDLTSSVLPLEMENSPQEIYLTIIQAVDLGLDRRYRRDRPRRLQVLAQPQSVLNPLTHTLIHTTDTSTTRKENSAT